MLWRKQNTVNMAPGVSVIKHFSSSLITKPNKLVHLPSAYLSRLILYYRIRAKPTWVQNPWGSPFLGWLLALTLYIRPSCKVLPGANALAYLVSSSVHYLNLTRNKHTSLFSLVISEKEIFLSFCNLEHTSVRYRNLLDKRTCWYSQMFWGNT